MYNYIAVNFSARVIKQVVYVHVHVQCISWWHYHAHNENTIVKPLETCDISVKSYMHMYYNSWLSQAIFPNYVLQWLDFSAEILMRMVMMFGFPRVWMIWPTHHLTAFLPRSPSHQPCSERDAGLEVSQPCLCTCADLNIILYVVSFGTHVHVSAHGHSTKTPDSFYYPRHLTVYLQFVP